MILIRITHDTLKLIRMLEPNRVLEPVMDEYYVRGTPDSIGFFVDREAALQLMAENEMLNPTCIPLWQ